MDSEIVQSLLKLLPLSPFPGFIAELVDIPFMGYINWLIPFHIFARIGAGWLVAVGVFYLYSVALRWAKAIE